TIDDDPRMPHALVSCSKENIMRRRNFLLLSGSGLAAAGLAACGGSGGGGGMSGGAEVEVFTWWAQGSEEAGVDALVEPSVKDPPALPFVHGAVAGGARTAATDRLQSRLQAGDPPHTFQAHAGLELADYIDAGHLEDVSDLYDAYGLTESFPGDL